MGYFSNLAIEIEEAWTKGATVEQIADRFDMDPVEVQAVIDFLSEADRDPVELI